MCRRTSGHFVASAWAVRVAASTGPTPQHKVSTPCTKESSRSVAATTSNMSRDATGAGAASCLTGGELAADLAGRILRRVHVDVEQVLLERRLEGGADR